MSRLLLRGAKSPWVPVTAESVLTQNVLATNIGNLLFGQSVFRALSVEGTEIVTNSYNSERDGIDDKYIQRINDEFDSFVVPLANFFRPSARHNMGNFTRVIEGLNIPVTVVGVGSQHPLNDEGEHDPLLDEAAKRFMSAVLDRSASVGVRGEETAAYLKRIGFGDEHIDIIGCPSIFMHGPNPEVRPLGARLAEAGSLAMSGSPETAVMAPMIMNHAKRFGRFRYIPQNSWDLDTIAWGEPRSQPDGVSPLVNPDNPLHLNDQIRFPLDPNTWVDYLRDFDFVLGSRVHGSIAGILAGAPTLLLAHDSRTRELANYHQIPYLPIDQVTENTRAEDLYQYADYTKFHSRLGETFDKFTSFLEKNNLSHIHQPEQKINDYDEKLNAADLPPMVHPILAETEAGRREVASRLRWLRQGKKVDSGRLQYAFRPDLPHTKLPEITAKSVGQRLTNEVSTLSHRQTETSKQLAATRKQQSKNRKQLEETRRQLEDSQKQLASTRKLVEAQAKVIKRLDVPMSRRAKRYIKRVINKPKNG